MTAPSVPDILTRIVEHKRIEIDRIQPRHDEFAQSALAKRSEHRDFMAALRQSTPAIIAEVKKASPSKGLLDPQFDPARRARQYHSGGAAALSVLTDERFFQGSLDDLRAARASVAVPVLRKDFTLSEVQVAEAAAAGADAVLLIAAILSRTELERLRTAASGYGLAALVEVHDDSELDRALESGAEIVGVNNRDLRTFDVRLETSERLAARMPSTVIRVSESGIHSRADVERLMQSGYTAFLVGEHLMKSGDPAAAIRELRG